MTLAHRFSELAAQLRAAMALAQLADNHTDDAGFNRLALSLFELQFETNTAYRQICEARQLVPSRVAHWSTIPPVPTTAFKELELSCLPHSARTAVFFSSGTTNRQPSRHFHSAESLRIYEHALLSWFEHNVLARPSNSLGNASDAWPVHLVVLTPRASAAPHSSLVHMFQTVFSRFGSSNSAFVGEVEPAGGWVLDVEKTIDVLRDAQNGRRPVLVLGTAFLFVNLLDELAARGLEFRFPAGSCALETGGYKNRSRSLPKAELHSLISGRLGMDRIISEYGMSELSSQAYQVAAKPGPLSAQTELGLRFPPWARVQLVSPETGREVGDGEAGLVRVFDLANVYSVLAIQTEDMALKSGTGFELLGRTANAELRGCSLMSI
jgi:hypothetical protein